MVCAGMHGYLGLGIVGLWWYLLVVRRTGSGSGNLGQQCNHRADMGRLGSVIGVFPVSPSSRNKPLVDSGLR